MHYPCTGVILAGGKNSRFNGRNKAFLPVRGKTVLERILESLDGFFQETLLITKTPAEYLDYDITIATDLFPSSSSLTGLHAGLFYAATPFVFLVGCDTPFIKREVVQTILDHVEADCDVVMPETADGMEPLCAVYAKSCLGLIESHLRLNRFKISRVFQKKRLVRVPEGTLREKDPEMRSFFNINTPEDLKKAEALFDLNP